MSSSLVLESVSNHPNSEKTQISPAYSSAAQSMISSTEGHFPLPFPFSFAFTLSVLSSGLNIVGTSLHSSHGLLPQLRTSLAHHHHLVL